MKAAAMTFSGAVLFMLSALLGISGTAHALEYVSVADSSAILYDAPSTRGKKLFVISRYTPLEKVVNLEGWLKVRDHTGSMTWIEKRAVSDNRYVVVTAPYATVRQAPEPNAAVLFQLSQHVAIESLGINGGGWIKVRHQDGATGFLKSVEVWGAE